MAARTGATLVAAATSASTLYDTAIGRDVRLLHTRHEAAAVHMADGWGRLTGRPGVAVGNVMIDGVAAPTFS